MNGHIKTSKDFSSDLVEAYKALIYEASRIAEALKALGIDPSVIDSMRPISLSVVDKSTTVKANKAKTRPMKSTFYDVVFAAFDKEGPLSSREILVKYKDATGKDVARKNIASRLSIASRTKDIASYEYSDGPSSTEYFWIRRSWLDNNGTLDSKYVAIIEDKLSK